MLPKRKHTGEITKTRHVRAVSNKVVAQLISGTYANK